LILTLPVIKHQKVMLDYRTHNASNSEMNGQEDSFVKCTFVSSFWLRRSLCPRCPDPVGLGPRCSLLYQQESVTIAPANG